MGTPGGALPGARPPSEGGCRGGNVQARLRGSGGSSSRLSTSSSPSGSIEVGELIERFTTDVGGEIAPDRAATLVQQQRLCRRFRRRRRPTCCSPPCRGSARDRFGTLAADLRRPTAGAAGLLSWRMCAGGPGGFSALCSGTRAGFLVWVTPPIRGPGGRAAARGSATTPGWGWNLDRVGRPELPAARSTLRGDPGVGRGGPAQSAMSVP